jgi:HSP20 family protein
MLARLVPQERVGKENAPMSNVTIRKQSGEKPAVPAQVEPAWDPWRTMRAILSWDPFREMAAYPAVEGGASVFAPAFDVKETKESYLFKADVPGIQDKDLEVTITGNRLTVGGTREEEKEEQRERYYAYERNYGSFSRSFTLPDGADTDKLQASLEQGVLTVTVPKRPEVQPKKIAVKAEGQGAKS